VHNFLIDFD